MDLVLLSTSLDSGLLAQQIPQLKSPSFLLSPQGKAAEENGFHYRNLRLVALDLFTAGSETTSTTLRWALLYMLLHPEIQGKSETYLQKCSLFLSRLIFLQGFHNKEQQSMDFARRSSFDDCWSGRNRRNTSQTAVLAWG